MSQKDHYGWKWWKSQDHDIEQIRLELIDIWHFGLSAELIRHGGNVESAATAMLKELEEYQDKPEAITDFKSGVDSLAMHALKDQILFVPVFLMLLSDVDTSFDDLHRIYVGKNVLNRFRQDHGYKDGSYRKQWDGREDNEHLSEIVASLDADAADFQDQIYSGLADRYPKN